MDSGLGVRWPLSPYATALAAGALFAFCLALWRHRAGAKKRTLKDPSGRLFGGDLDPKKEQDASGSKTSKEEKNESEVEKQRNFPVLAFTDIARGFSYEHMCSPGRFGAVPKSSQRNQALEYPNLYSVFRRKNVRKEDDKDWQGVNSTSSNFSCIYQQPLCFTNELPRLNARFLLNLSPHLQPFIRRFGDFQISEVSQPNDFENFDVALKPEILKNKPITRSAVCLALDRQLHKFLEEPFREIKSNERAIQTAEITEDDDDNGASGDSNLRVIPLEPDSEIRGQEKLQNNQRDKKASSESCLWDSGYGEKAFDDRCSTPKEFKDSDNVLIEEYDEYSDNISQTLNIEVTQSTEIKECVVTEVDHSNFTDILSISEPSIRCENLNIIKYSDILKQTCDNVVPESNNTDVEFDTDNQVEKHDNIELKVSDNPTQSQSKDILNTLKESGSSQDLRTDQLIKVSEVEGQFNRDKLSEFSVEHVSELDVQINLSGSNAAEIPNEPTNNLNFENNVNASDVNKCSDREFESYHGEIHASSSEENIYLDMENNSDMRSDNETETLVSSNNTENSIIFEVEQMVENSSVPALDLEQVQRSSAEASREESGDEHLFRTFQKSNEEEKNDLGLTTCIHSVDVGGARVDHSIECSTTTDLENSELERIQSEFDYAEEQNNISRLSVMLETKRSEKRNSRAAAPPDDVTAEGSSRDSAAFDERGTFNSPRQMDRETGERSVAVESTVTTETTLRANGDAHLSTAVVSRLTLDDWSALGKDSVSVKTTVSDEVFRPTFEEFVPLKSSEKILQNETNGRGETFEDGIPLSSRNGSDPRELQKSLSSGDLPSSPRTDRLQGLLSRDEQRRSRTKFHHLADGSHVGGAMEGEWDRLLRDVLASVSELERWERRQCDVSSDAEDAEQQRHPQSDSSLSMEEEAALSPKGETPTKVKSLRFKLDPDVFDVPSDDSFYDDDHDNEGSRRGWKKQPKYRAFSSLELEDEPVRLVSVHASVVPGGQKMVARPVGIDLRVRLTEERQSKRAHVSTSPSQAKRRSPVSDRGIGWCQELSPVTENVDWRDTFTPVTPECKPVPNGILKTPSPKIEPSPVESPNPFKVENGVVTNGVSQATEKKPAEKPKYNGWKPPVEKKPFLIIRKKFEPDPEAVERITGYKSALSKPPLPPPPPHKVSSNLSLRNRAEMARKQYLDNKAALANSRVDGTKKFQQFLSQAQSDRARIVTSVPDLVAIEKAVTEQWTKERQSVSPRESPGREENNRKPDSAVVSRGSTPDDKWASYVQSCRQHLGRRSQSMTYLETDIDIIPVLDDDDKCHSTSALDEPDEALPDPDDSDLDESREDLDDSGRAKSEHELRIERSLRNMPLPDWYRRSDKTKTGFLLGSSNKEKRGWAAAKSLASSTSSLASCGLRRPVRSLRSSRENIPWSRSSASPDGQTLSLALAKAFREPYLGWRARTPTSSGVSSSPRASPPSWNATTTTTDDEANGVSFDGEDAFGRTTSSEDDRKDEPLSLDDTGADAVTVSMDTNDPVKLPGGEDTCDDINNMSMDTCELFDASVVVPVDEDPSPQADTGDDIDNLSTDTTTTEGRKLDPKLKRYSYSQSIYHSEWDEEEESRGDRKSKGENREPSPGSADHKVVWIESSFVGSRTTTSIMVLPEKKTRGSSQERPASR